MVTFSNEEMGFSYRSCAIDPSVIFTGALFTGKSDDRTAIRAAMDEVQSTARRPSRSARRPALDLQEPARPVGWKLIDAAGCRGLRMGGAQVSEMHCNFLINTAARRRRISKISRGGAPPRDGAQRRRASVGDQAHRRAGLIPGRLSTS